MVLSGLKLDYDWKRHDKPGIIVADIAGGVGTVLNLILQSMPNARGILFDQPSVIAQAKESPLWGPNVTDRVSYVGGDMFKSVPEADLYILRWIIHDWDDERSIQILKVLSIGCLCECLLHKTIRASMKPTSRLLILEEPLPDEGNPMPTSAIISPSFMDILMMLVASGKHRTMAQYNELFQASDLKLQRIDYVRPSMGILEIVPSS